MQTTHRKSGAKSRRPRVTRINITMPGDLLEKGAERAAALQFPSLSAYIQNFVRIDCGLVVTVK